MQKLKFMTFVAILILTSWSCKTKQEKMETDLRDFISSFEEKGIPLYKNSALASWNANVSGKAEDYAESEKASFEYAKVFTDTVAFARLKKIKDSGEVKDSILARELELLYNGFLGGQVDTALIAQQIKMETEISRKYGNFRANLNGKAVTDNEVENILRNSTNSVELQKAWEGSKMIGPEVADDIIKLVKHRNLIAKKLGFNNYHEMSLKLSGQEPSEVTAILDELDNLTKEGFVKLKNEIDMYFSKRYKVPAGQLQPWHYQNRYFQEAPEIYSVDFDKYYEKQDPVKLVSTFYAGIGLDAEPVLSKSDLYEKPGKNQHAFCTDIDRAGDVRALTNIRPDSYWMNTILHELGHGVYSYYNDRDLPFTLRDAAHAFTTEAIANLFGRFATDPGWMYGMGIIDEKERDAINENSRMALRLQMLVFSRWVQVMYHFEKSMYENPDQDLNKLWWDNVEKYQLLKKPEGRNMPDWATKIHVALYPCYYHNYLLGEMLASQLYSYITTNVTTNKSFVNDKAVGEYLKKYVFQPGSRYYWNEMIERATGEKLTAKYYAEQFVK
ncbi:MAG TPA: M2 family metallopeptidase [Bacteroidales bacterium]|nr:M2 family metallopeptidase [Bacteroidales bacterium]